MYIPKHFSNDDMATAIHLIAENAFGILMSPVGSEDAGPQLSHLPMLYVEREGQGYIIGHVAKANAHWKSFDGASPAVAVFSGPHAYISPNWYTTEAMVPTWNYAAVHVHGLPVAITDDAQAEAILAQLVSAFESDDTGNWSMSSLPEGHVGRQLKGIVAFEMPISKIETKLKLSQNRSADDIKGVIDALSGSPRQSDQATARMMKEMGKE